MRGHEDVAEVSRRLSAALFAIALLAALACAPSPGASAPTPRLASLLIEIWLEYDRPQALVILKGELAPDAALPAALALRLPDSSGGLSAVAYADALGKLLNLAYEREDTPDFVVLRLKTPQHSFHVEFYEPLAPGTQRRYRYAWPGDLAVDQLAVLVKEPAAGSNLSVQPRLDSAAVSPDGLNYRTAQLGAFERGQQLPIEVRYTKTDPRTSAEILAATAPPANLEGDARPVRLFLSLGAALLVLGAGIAFAWWRWRRLARRAAGAGFCPKCGAAAVPADRFCAGCGTALARQRPGS